jgi:hypothetical protein
MGHSSSKYKFELLGHSLSPLHALGNWIEMMVFDPENKRDHVFEAWIRLVQNEYETYM